jgi:hypothetical protein
MTSASKRPRSKQPPHAKGNRRRKQPLAKTGKTASGKAQGRKFALRPYKPRKRKAAKGRSADAILRSARAEKAALVKRGSARPPKRTWTSLAYASDRNELPAYRSAYQQSTPMPAKPPRSTARAIFAPIIDPVGNGPVIASGHGQFDARPEVWSADDFFVILEANPEPSSKLPVHLIGFRYLMSASCFYRASRNPYPHPHPRPIMIYTLEHSAVLAHDRPGFFGQLLGEKAKPINMIVGLFLNNLRTQLPGVSYDEDFTRGRQRLLALVRERLGISAYFDHAGYFNRGQLLPAMR